MKGTVLLTIVMLSCALAIPMARSQEGAQSPGGMQMPSPEEMKAMMEKMEKAKTPGKAHKLLQQFVGEWDITIRIFFGGPGSDAIETKGKASIKSVLDGRFIQEEMTGEVMFPDETGAMKSMPFKGLGMTGYDNYRNMYVGTWADNQNTYLLTMRGMADPTGKVITSYGEMDEPMMDVFGRTVKYVTRIVDDNKHVFEIIDLHAGDNYKVVEVEYVRRK